MSSGTPTRPTVHRSPRVRAATVLALAVVALGAPTASAHDSLVGSDPEPGAVLDAVPEQVVLTFSSDVQELGTTLELQDSGGGLAAQGTTSVDGRDVVLPVPSDLAAGDYTVVYRVTSSDGHPVDGEVPFTLDVAAPATTDPSTASPTGPTPSGGSSAPSSTAAPSPSTAPGPSATAGAAGAVADDADPAAATTDGSFPWVPVLVVVLVLALGGLAAGVLARRRGTAR